MPSAKDLVNEAPSLASILGEVDAKDVEDLGDVDAGTTELIDAGMLLPDGEQEELPDQSDEEMLEDEEKALGLTKDKAQVETPAADAKVVAPAISEPELAQLRADAEFGSTITSRFQEDPAGLVAALLSNMPAAAQQRAIEQAGIAPSQVKATEEEPQIDTEGLTPQEVFVEKNKKQITSLVEQQVALSKLPEQFDYLFQAVDAAYSNLALEAHTTRAFVEALLEAQGVEMPSLDMQALNKSLQAGKVLKDAIHEQIRPKAKESIARRQQQQKKRPNTPAGGGPTNADLPDGKVSLAQIMQAKGWMS